MIRPVHVEFLMGLGGHLTSPGIDTMAYQTRQLGAGFSVGVGAWDEWREAGKTLSGLPKGTAKAIVGYSNGASEVTGVSDMGFPIDLLVALDPTIWLACSPLHGNVHNAIVFHNVNPFSSFPPVGHASLTKGTGWDDHAQTLRTIDTWDMHTSVDTDPVIQATVIAAIKQLS